VTITRIPVGGEQPYQVLVGSDLLGELPGLLPGATRVAVLSAPPVASYADATAAHLEKAGLEVVRIEVPDAEAGKTIEVAQRCWERLGRSGFTRTDAVVGVGGGAVTDLAGFVAACWLRGVRWIPVSTSVNGMVDAALGGKTGVNTAAGKNLVGAFYPPVAVLSALDALPTLPPEQLRAGLAEVVKGGFIADPAILDLIESHPAAAVDPRSDVLRELIERKIRIKAYVVGEDLRESGLREILNYGHTLGHAIERLENYRWSHGHGVSVGLVYAAELGVRTGRLDSATADRHHAVLTLLGLPTSYRADAYDQLRAKMAVDKKARGHALRFVLLDGLARPVTVPISDEALLRDAYRSVGV
jgi:3-dehydroquinate synthase